MQRHKATAILLDVFNLQERDRIVAFLTAEHGQKRGVARGARAKYSRFAGQLQPLAKVEVNWFEKDGRDLVRIGDVDLIRPAAPLQVDLEGILLGAYMAEHMTVFAQENDASPKLFRLLDSTIDALLAGADQHLAARFYEIWVLRLAGIFPVPWECPSCGRALEERAVVIPNDVALLCPACGTEEGGGGARFEIGASVLDFLRRSSQENLEALARHPPSPGVLDRTEELCARIRRDFLQAELKSYRVMRRTLGTLRAEAC